MPVIEDFVCLISRNHHMMKAKVQLAVEPLDQDAGEFIYLLLTSLLLLTSIFSTSMLESLIAVINHVVEIKENTLSHQDQPKPAS